MLGIPFTDLLQHHEQQTWPGRHRGSDTVACEHGHLGADYKYQDNQHHNSHCQAFSALCQSLAPFLAASTAVNHCRAQQAAMQEL